MKRLHIELDNGPESSSSRTQFLKRLVGFADRHQVTVELAYLPPYHSKSNPVERCWGILERHWNGALLSTVADVLRWAESMTWRGLHPLVRTTTTVYERGVYSGLHLQDQKSAFENSLSAYRDFGCHRPVTPASQDDDIQNHPTACTLAGVRYPND